MAKKHNRDLQNSFYNTPRTTEQCFYHNAKSLPFTAKLSLKVRIFKFP